jgi:hypothetical protein
VTNPLQYIEQYFTGQLTAEERLDFEKKCESDVDFAREVGLYISMRGALKKSLRDFKKKDLEAFYETHQKKEVLKPKTIPMFAYISAIAASILIFLAVYYYMDKPDAQRIASAYITENLDVISISMGTVQDSLAMGINAYNEKDYTRARRIFTDLQDHPSVEFECAKYLGLVHLMTGSYDEAIAQFDRLAGFTDAYANPGLFYKALTLMKRSSESDVANAKNILKLVVKEKKAGHKEAERWLDKLE